MSNFNEAIAEDVKQEFMTLILNESEDSKNHYTINLNRILEWLGLKTTTKRNILKRYIRDDTLFIESNSREEPDGHFYVEKINRKKEYFFSNEGFKLMCLCVRSPKSKYIYDYFIQCEKNYIRSLKQSAEENKKELAGLMDKYRLVKSKVKSLTDERDELLNLVSIGNANTERLKHIEQNFLVDDDIYFGSDDMRICNYLKAKFLKQIEIYVIDDREVNKPPAAPKKNSTLKINVENSEVRSAESIQYEIEFESLTGEEIVNDYPDMLLYYYIPPKKSSNRKLISVGTISFMSQDHINYAKQILKNRNEEYTLNRKYKNVFVTTYESIQDAFNQFYNQCLIKELNIEPVDDYIPIELVL